MRCRLLALAALFLSASVASAGPFQWAWSLSVVPLAETNTLFAADAGNPAKGYTLPFAPITASDPGPIVPPTFPTTASIGVTTFRYLYQDGYPYNWVPADAPADPNASKFKVTINATELSSGATGTQVFVGTLSYHRGASGEVIPDVSFDVSRVVWDLGGYKFDVRLETPYNPDLRWRSVTSEWEMSSLSTPPENPGGGGTGTPTDTPEPGTIILGGIALVGGLAACAARKKAGAPDLSGDPARFPLTR